MTFVEPSRGTESSSRAPGSRRFVARTRGQVMVLGCVALVVTVLMLMASFSLATAVHERIRIQSHADAQAFSLATLEARAFNVTAHYNRAIGAALVAQMSLHSWMAIITADVAMLYSGRNALYAIAALETLMGCYPPKNVKHCPCVIKAIKSAVKMGRAARKWDNTAKGLESQFNKGVKGIKEMIDSLNEQQLKVLSRTKGELNGGAVLNSLKNANAKASQYETGINSMTTQNFVCALEGTDMDEDCQDSNRKKASLADRSVIIGNTANATRHAFAEKGLSSSIISHQNFAGPMQADVPQNALSDGTWTHAFKTTSRVGQGAGKNSQNTAEAKNVGAFASGGIAILNFRHVPFMPWSLSARIISGESNQHRGSAGFRGHQGSHNEFQAQMAQEPCNRQNCFVNFRASADPDIDFGQPSVYGAVSQSLRVYQTQGDSFNEEAPWEINKDGEVKLKLENSKEAKLKFVPRGRGYAVAKAKTYFHQLGNWQVAPNFFDPFWRAKLHFFKTKEFEQALQKSGDPKATQIYGAKAPVEGEAQ